MLRSRREADSLRVALRDATARLDDCSRQLDVLAGALDALPFGLFILDGDGVVRRRPRTAALSGHEQVLLDETVEDVGRRASEGESLQERIDLFGPPPRAFQCRGIPLGGEGALVVVDEITERVRLDAVRTDFVANISHELKTPVAGLAVLAEAIAEGDDADVTRSLAARMVDEAHRASAVIDDLLELSRIELGGAAVRELVDLGAVVAEAAQRVRSSAVLRDVRIEIDDRSNAKSLGDVRQLVSAVVNLLDNSVKYSQTGSAVRVVVSSVDGTNGVSVIDTGIGIPAKDLDRVFERFYRVDRARSRETGGTGLGLAIVRHVASNHGGEVVVQSREGEGSTFTLRIPAAEA